MSHRLRSVLGALVATATAVAPLRPALAQPAPVGASQPAPSSAPGAAAPADPVAASDEPDEAAEVDIAVAGALYDRARLLFDRGDWADAKSLAIESLERSARGPQVRDALDLLRRCNAKLGIGNLDDGAPASIVGSVTPVDPYGGDAAPADPYSGDAAPVDPYGDAAVDPNVADALTSVGVDTGEPPVDPGDRRRGHRAVIAAGVTQGALLGVALVGPHDGDDFDGSESNVGSAVIAGLALGAGGGLAAHYLTRKRDISEGQANATLSAGVWGGAAGAFLADAFTGSDETTTAEGFAGASIGGLLGTAAGALYARHASPSVNDVALTNSLAAYGAGGGLLLGVAMDPPKGEAYSLNASFGIAGGVLVGLYLADRVEISRARMLRVDIGAVAGAAAPWLLYAVTQDDGTNDDEQLFGFLSAAGMVGGALIAYRLTRHFDDKPLGPGDPVPVAGLVQRHSDGTWTAGAPALIPANNAALGPTLGRGLGLTVLGARF